MKTCVNTTIAKKFLKQCAALSVGLCSLFYAQSVNAQFYNGSQQAFGKNRVQFKEFNWSFYRYTNYDVYFYKGGQPLGAFTAKYVDIELADLEKIIDYKLDGKLKFIVFNSLADMKQSNIGIDQEEEMNTAGLTHISGNKIFLYYNGSHEDLRRQIRAGLAQLLVHQVVYGGDLKDRLQNAAVLVLPDWYIEGLVSYLSVKWSVDIDNQVRDGIATKRYRKFNKLEGQDAAVAGHAIWGYIVEKYGQNSLPNILYMTRSGRSIDNGFLFTINVSMKTLSKEWFEYYDKKFYDIDIDKARITNKPLIKRPKSYVYSQLKMSADAEYVAYVTNDIGRYKVWLYNVNNQKRKVIMRGGYRSLSQKADESFPRMAWNPKSNILAIIREYEGNPVLTLYNVGDGRKEESVMFNFEKVLDFSYADDGKNFVMSAVQHGQTDIFVYTIASHAGEQITHDSFDDINPRFLNGSKSIAFSSNRTSDTLFAESKNTIATPTPNYDIFIYDYKKKNTVMTRVTNTPYTNETEIMPFDKGHFSFLSDENGIRNRYLAKIDSVITTIDTTLNYRYVVNSYANTNYSRNIIQHDINPKKKKYANLMYDKGKYWLYMGDLPKSSSIKDRERLEYTPYKAALLKKTGILKKDSVAPVKKPVVVTPKDSTSAKDSAKIDIQNYTFQSDMPKPRHKKISTPTEPVFVTKADTGAGVREISKEKLFRLPTQRTYEEAFKPSYFVSSVDNAYLSQSYQIFTGAGYTYPSLGALIKIGTADLFEDYKIEGGFRLPFNLGSNEYLISIEDRKKRLDKQLVFDRQNEIYPVPNANFAVKLTSHEGRYILKWPFSEIMALKGTVGFRNDRAVYLSTDIAPLLQPNEYQNFGSAKLEFIFDNTISPGLNLHVGTRYKIFAEAYRQVDKLSSTTLSVVGFDLRHYERIHRCIIWANRLAASTNLGSQRLIYYMGGIDNPIVVGNNFINAFDPSTPIDYLQNYTYQAAATEVRGFIQNARNGNSFMAASTELRVPVFRYLLNRPIKSDFVKNFQITPFVDAGTAWNGPSPYSNSVLNTTTIYQNPVLVTVTTQADPILVGYGFGLRSKLLGYFIRTDWAWGIKDGVIQPQIFYLSLNTDF